MSDSLPVRASVTLLDVAVRCGVSKTTVIRALSGTGRISPGTQARILAVAQEMGYNPHQHKAARRMSLRRYGKTDINHIIALLLPERSHRANYFGDMMEGAQDALSANGFATVIMRTPLPGATTWTAPPVFAGGEVDAIIGFADWALISRTLASMTGAGTPLPPLVSLMYPVAPGTHSVRADERTGALLATRHLLQLGHRHVLQMYNSAYPSGRLEGIHAAYQELRLEAEQFVHFGPWYLGIIMPDRHLDTLDLDLLEQQAPNSFLQQQVHSFLAFLREHPEVTGILAQNDALARRIWYLLRQAGYTIPGDYSLIGFDDTDTFLDERGHNLLTTINLPLVEIGRQAALLALRHIHNPQLPFEERILPTSLRIRASTGTPAQRN